MNKTTLINKWTNYSQLPTHPADYILKVWLKVEPWFCVCRGHVEKRYPDGVSEVCHPSGQVERTHPNGTQEIVFTDDTIIRVDQNGNRILHLPNGQVEYHTKDYHKRVYADGTEKIVHSDGAQETRYSNGRRRFKDKDGKLIYDITQEGTSLV
jgi:hypothetical protein